MESVKSVLVTHFGGYDSLKISNHPLKNLEENEIEVDVHFCGLNFADLYTRQGLIPRNEMPFVLGMECSGLITRVGKNVTSSKTGDRVVCYDYTGGMYRTKVIVAATKCFTIPENVTLKQATTLFVNYLTAYYSIMEFGRLQTGQSVFIHSCAGGVGWAATQLSKLIENVKIFGTTSPEKETFVKQNGVQTVLKYKNYKQQINELNPNGFDLIIDNQSGGNFGQNFELLKKPFGRIVLIGANNLIQNEQQLNENVFKTMQTDFPTNDLFMNNMSVSGLHLGVIAENDPDLIQTTLNKLYQLLSERKIEVRIDSVWKLDEIVEATKRLQERRNVGKVLLTLKDEDEKKTII